VYACASPVEPLLRLLPKHSCAAPVCRTKCHTYSNATVFSTSPMSIRFYSFLPPSLPSPRLIFPRDAADKWAPHRPETFP
jgi:hypothetical protein